jgi:arylsulfatase A-like enzyme
MRILVVNTVGLHLGYLGCYGNDWIATPNLDRLAAEGVVFDQHFVRVPLVAPSSCMSDWIEPARFRLDDFDVADSVLRLEGPSLAAPWIIDDDLLTMYTEDDEVEPWPDPPLGELNDDEGILRVQDTYAAAVTWFDAQFGQLLDEISKRSWAHELLLAFTASSGYPLGEHGRVGWDRPWLYEELVHVPLIIRFPAQLFAGTRIAALTQPADLALALDMWQSRLPGADFFTGGGDVKLTSLISGDVQEIRPQAISSWRVGPRSEKAVRTAEWAFLLSGNQDADDPVRPRQLYVKPDDRWEVNNVAERDFEKAEELERLLRNENDDG